MPTVSHSWKASLPIRWVAHLAGDDDEGDGIHQRVGQAGDRVGGAGTRRHQHDAGLAGRAGIAFRRMDRALLVADQNVDEFVVLEERIVDRQNRAAGIAENVPDALILERPDHDLRAGQFPPSAVSFSVLVILHVTLQSDPCVTRQTKGAFPPLANPRPR